MAGNYAALATLWGTLSGTTAQKLAAVNAATSPGPPQDILVSTLVNGLGAGNKMTGLTNFIANPGGASAAAIEAATYLLLLVQGADGPTLPTGTPSFYAQMQTWMAALVVYSAQTGITQANSNGFFAMMATTVPWWSANGFSGPVQVLDLVAAGNLL